jgi:hypothetical protein
VLLALIPCAATNRRTMIGFAVLVVREDGKIVEENMFDASVIVYR